MSITDELRKWGYGFCGDTHDVVTAIADRIDAEHRKQVTDAFTKGAIDGIDMAEHSIEYVKLPVDADGVPIHVGDRLRFNNGMIAEVRYLKIDSGGTSVCVLATNGGGDFYAITDKAHHYHAPTVEDVLEELLREYDRDDSELTNGEIVEMFAKRLTLAGDAE